MINFTFSKSSVRNGSSITKGVTAAYQRYFHRALLNLELNLQEERLKKQRVN